MENLEKIKLYTERCLNCKVKPCQKGCPLSNDIPTFISFVKEGNIKRAYEILTNTTMLGSVCGRICPHKKQCKGNCIRGIKGEPVNIGEIESYVFDKAIENGYQNSLEKSKELKGKNIAVIGSGPASLNASAFLARTGASVTIYEKHNELGGILRYGIPEFRLPKKILDRTIEQILDLGISTKFGQELGKNISIEELKRTYDAIFIGIGANIPKIMNIEGENIEGVYGGNTLLENAKHPDYKNKSVAIIGGGNVAMDCARTIKYMGASKVYVIYRRAEQQMPAEEKEINDAKKEGIEFLFQNNIVKILGNEKVEKIECVKTRLVKSQEEEREIPIDVEGSNYKINIDYVIIAIGSNPQKEIIEKLNLDLDEKGYIKVNEQYQTSDKMVYAGGDIIGQKATVAWAAKAGREAAKAIIENLKKQ